MAKLLAQDLERFAPGYNCIIYTDRPALFADQSNVRAVKHICRGVLPYNERRFALWHALSIASSVMYLDADVRICSPIPTNLEFAPGLTARSCGNLQKHMADQQSKYSQSKCYQHQRYVIDKMADRVGIDRQSQALKFINEFLFVVSDHGGLERDFLRTWGDLAVYADTMGMHQHPTYAMALAAAKCDFPVYHSEMVGLDFFDDRIEKVRISKGQSTQATKAQYFHQQTTIEQSRVSTYQRFLTAKRKQATLLLRHARVQVIFKVSPSVLIDYPTTQPGK